MVLHIVDNFNYAITEHDLSMHTQGIQFFYILVRVLKLDLGHYSV